jgi:hypothetical protein
MTRPLKYLEGPPITGLDEFAAHIEAGNYFIDARTKRRIHPAWANSWQFNMVRAAVRRGHILQAIPNPEYPASDEDAA